MVVQKEKLDLILARRQTCLTDFRGKMSPITLRKINAGEEVRTKTVGKLAALLQCDPAELIDMPSSRKEGWT